ncbi:mechanosensitive ion channel [Robertkochia marina]|uniref:Mechanosensitive ion channel n=1 Tax=Robertkochia marina TaxID=1227945 RepID=A0A4S3M4I3_9FLAO|nr:mechanosensitive ion channel domain-containing protein [Robertkochia marina]THD69589.1 mechanosensitive ion channel [Robertkochia marina]TRZ47156.1 mechanosensitive ion channel family protein [Robertkochia marina]
MQESTQSNDFLEKALEFIQNIDLQAIALKVLAAIAIYIIGGWLIGRVVRIADKIMAKRDYESSLRGFLKNLISWSLKILLIVAILGTFGIETTSFAAIIAAAGLAIGLALQGSMSNFAGGVLILIFKPFRVGDFIEAQGMSGTVKEIGIINTRLSTFGNQIAIIPNGKLANDNILNYSAENTRRENLTFGISYDSDIKKAKEILTDIVNNFDKVMKDPAPQVMVAELAESSVNLSLRYWATNADFWDCRWHIIEEAKMRFDAEGIEIPFPHMVEIQKKA